MLLFIAVAGSMVSSHIRITIQKRIPILVVMIGMFFILRGLALGIPYIYGDEPPSQQGIQLADGAVIAAEIDKLPDSLRQEMLDVLAIAEIAGIQGGKRTSDLIPLCHPLQITKLDVKATLDKTGVSIESLARCAGQTGIEMEALTAVSVALLTIYDMCKAVDKTMVIGEIRLMEKTKVDLI